MKLFQWFLFLLIACCYNLKGQKTNIRGQIIADVENPSEIDLEGIRIFNKNSSDTVYTNIYGVFNLDVKTGDSVRIEPFVLNKRTIIISERIINQKKIFVHLNEAVIELETANITKFRTSGYLTDEVDRLANRPDTIAQLYENLGLDPKVQDIVPQENIEKLGFADFFPLSPNLGRISQAISGDLKRKRNLRKYVKAQERYQKIRNYFTNEHFIDYLGIPENQIDDFIVYCYYKDNLESAVNSNNYFLISNSLENRNKEFIELLKSENLLKE